MSPATPVRLDRRARRALLRLVGRVGRSSPGAAQLLAGSATVLGAFARPRRARQALAWARLHRDTPRAQMALGLAVLANRGRFLALWASDPGRMRLDGREHLDACAGRGTIVLTFHLGPGASGRVLGASGYATRGTGESAGLMGRRAARRREADRPADARPVQWQREDVASRGVGLLRARAHLLAGATVRMSADGGAGRPLFEIPLPGVDFAIRAGWWILRRQTGVPVVPMLVHRDGSKVVGELHPPLPGPLDDPELDRAQCRDALAAVLGDYVRRFPEQCVTLALRSAYGHVIRRAPGS